MWVMNENGDKLINLDNASSIISHDGKIYVKCGGGAYELCDYENISERDAMNALTQDLIQAGLHCIVPEKIYDMFET